MRYSDLLIVFSTSLLFLGLIVAMSLFMRGCFRSTFAASLFAILCVLTVTPIGLGRVNISHWVEIIPSVFLLPSVVDSNAWIWDALLYEREFNLLSAMVTAAIAFLFSKTVLFGPALPRARDVIVAPFVGAICYLGLGLAISSVVAIVDNENFVDTAVFYMALTAASYITLVSYAYPLRFKIFRAPRYQVLVDAIIVLIPLVIFSWLVEGELVLISIVSLPFIAGYWAFVKCISTNTDNDLSRISRR